MTTENKLTNDIEKIVTKIITPKNKQDFFGFGASLIDDVVFHDFSQYIYVKTPIYATLIHSKSISENQNIANTFDDDYPFRCYNRESWNFGLRLTHRQEWRPFGNQRGELVRTLPLGPGQIEKISTKMIKRNKVTQTSENLRSTETNIETSDTSKDSSEVVKEAANSFGWYVEAEDSVNYGFGLGKISGGMESNSEKKSKNTNNSLSESMHKSASKIKTESIVISRESESTFEESYSSEIQNPNEDIPITYVYSKLQRQYEIFTQLVQVTDIMMVAEPVPDPKDITISWIRKHDWILAKVLLDDSFRDILNSISSEVEQSTEALDALSVTSQGNLSSTIDHMGKLAENIGDISLSNMDIISGTQQRHTESVKELVERQKEKRILEYKRCRLAQHIRDNILHYCRAIWDQEDPEQKMPRYRKMDVMIPTNYIFDGRIGVENDEWNLDTLLRLFHGTTSNDATTILDGWFEPARDSEKIELTDILKPGGPIGYIGNYAIFYMSPDVVSENMFAMLSILKTPYLYYPDSNSEDNYEDAVLVDPTLKAYIKKYYKKGPKNQDEKEEMLQYLSAIKVKGLKAKLKDEETSQAKSTTVEGETESTKTMLENFFSDKDFEGKALSEDESIFKIGSKDNLTGIPHYAEYKFRKDTSHKILVDTNNLVLDIMPGEGSVLESFKLAHRSTDVSKAVTKQETMKLENIRRKALLDKNI